MNKNMDAFRPTFGQIAGQLKDATELHKRMVEERYEEYQRRAEIQKKMMIFKLDCNLKKQIRTLWNLYSADDQRQYLETLARQRNVKIKPFGRNNYNNPNTNLNNIQIQSDEKMPNDSFNNNYNNTNNNNNNVNLNNLNNNSNNNNNNFNSRNNIKINRQQSKMSQMNQINQMRSKMRNGYFNSNVSITGINCNIESTERSSNFISNRKNQNKNQIINDKTRTKKQSKMKFNKPNSTRQKEKAQKKQRKRTKSQQFQPTTPTQKSTKMKKKSRKSMSSINIGNEQENKRIRQELGKYILVSSESNSNDSNSNEVFSYSCKICLKKFKSKPGTLSHIGKHHATNDQKIHKCNINQCNLSFALKELLTQHMNQKHNYKQNNKNKNKFKDTNKETVTRRMPKTKGKEKAKATQLKRRSKSDVYSNSNVKIGRNGNGVNTATRSKQRVRQMSGNYDL